MQFSQTLNPEHRQQPALLHRLHLTVHILPIKNIFILLQLDKEHRLFSPMQVHEIVSITRL
mgnify:CR=1 FL=1